MTSPKSKGPGFQGSENAGCQMTVYSQGEDPATTVYEGATSISGRSQFDQSPCLISLSTQKSIGQAGQFTATIKCPPGTSMLNECLDDDWFDIVFTRHTTKWHCMRGTIDEVRKVSTVGGSGATNVVYTVTGRDFQKVFESTPIWFDMYSGEAAYGGAAHQVFNSDSYSPSVKATVYAFLNGFLRVLNGIGRANWVLPPSMPNAPSSGAFIDAVNFNDSQTADNPERFAVNNNFAMPDGTSWQLASQWSDPVFCEFYTELLPNSGTVSYDGATSLSNGLSIANSAMTVVLRDRPFLAVDPASGVAVGQASPWFSLPMYEVPRQYVQVSDVGRNGFERFNAYYCNESLVQERLKEKLVQVSGALWDTGDILYHGMKRYDIVSQYYYPNVSDMVAQRVKVKDWNCANPYYFNGSISFGIGLPDLKIGTRLRILGNDPTQDETYYVEGVSHNWNLLNGMRTTATVTRGFVGTNDQLINLVRTAGGNYDVQSQAEAGVSLTDALSKIGNAV